MSVTDEGTGPTEKFMEDYGVEYAVAYDKGGKLARWFGVRGIPDAALVDPSGTVVWKGHPGNLTSADIEKALDGALPMPMWEWPKSASGVRKALQKGMYGTALTQAQKLEGDEAETIVAAVRGIIDSRMATMKSANEMGDFLTASELSSSLAKALKGMPEGDEAGALADKLKGDSDVQAVIKGQKDVAKLAEKANELKKKKDADKLIDKLRKLSEKHAGSYAATQAVELADAIRKKRNDLR